MCECAGCKVSDQQKRESKEPGKSPAELAIFTKAFLPTKFSKPTRTGGIAPKVQRHPSKELSGLNYHVHSYAACWACDKTVKMHNTQSMNLHARNCCNFVFQGLAQHKRADMTISRHKAINVSKNNADILSATSYQPWTSDLSR